MGLAPLVVQSIFSTLKRLNREEGLSILLAEQNSTVALQYADRAAVLENGVSVLDGCRRDCGSAPTSRPSISASANAASAPDARASVAA